MNLARKISFGTAPSSSSSTPAKKTSFSTPGKKTSFSFSGSLSRTFSQTRGSSLGRAADEIIDSDGRRLVHIESTSSSFKVIENVGACYISVKLVLPDGHEIPKEKVRGDTPGSGNSPEITATLGNFYKLTPGGLPKVIVQLKRKNLASHSTVGMAEFDLEDVNDDLDDKKDSADTAQSNAQAADNSVMAARSVANEAIKAAEAANNALEAAAVKQAAKAPPLDSEGEAPAATGGEDPLLKLKEAAASANSAVEAAKKAVRSAEDYAETANEDSRKAANEAESSIEKKVYLSQATPENQSIRGSSFLGGSALESGGQPIGYINFSIYFSGGEEGSNGDSKPKSALKKDNNRRLSFVGEDEDDEEDEKAPDLLPDDLPPGCPKIEERSGKDFKEEEYYPNEIEAIIVSGRGLRAMDGKTLLNRNPKSDPFLKMSIGKKSAKTKAIKQTLDPNWHTRLTLPAPDIDKALAFTVYDEDFGGVSKDFMGLADIPLKSLFNKEPVRRTLVLKNKNGAEEEQPFGKIDVVVRWRFNQDLPMNLELIEEGAAMGEDDDDDDDEDLPDADDSAEGKAKAEEDMKAALAAVDDTKVISGDYMLSVHIIEARELKAKDDCGTSDPVVYVEAFGKKVNTAIIPKTLNPVWDDSFTVSVRNLDADDFAESILKIQVYDADTLTRNDLIGSYILDAMYVYQQKGHELHKQWVGLVNEQDPTDDGLQGYLKLSIAIVGPKDKPVIHKDNEDEGGGAGKAKGKDLGSLVLMPPTIRTVNKWLVITVHFAEYLPKMDTAGAIGAALGSTGGIDAYYTVQFGDRKPFKSKVVKTKATSRELMNPVFNQELWIPVTFPAMSAKIKHGVWDHDWGPDPDDLVTIFSTDIKFLEKYLNKGHKKMGPTWMNLYGASVCKDPNAIANALGGLVGASDAGKWATKYNKHPEKASTYRGRILITQSIRENAPEKDGPKPNKKGGFDPWKRKAKRLKMAQEPPSCLYKLRACVMSGVELPIKFHKLLIIISIGKYEIRTTGVANNNGTAEWFFKGDVEAELPVDINSIPDCFVYLCKYDKVEPMPFCFTRMKPSDIFSDGLNGEPSYWPDFRWLYLQEDKSLDALPGRMFPGAVLLKIGLSKIEVDEINTLKKWKLFDLNQYRKKTAFCVRVHVFMGSNLPAADENGLLDPYLKIGFGANKKLISRKQYDTRDPLFTASFDFNTTLCDDLSVAPPVCLHLFDYDWGPDADDFCGIAFAPMADAFVQLDDQRDLDEHKVKSLNLPSTMNVIQPSDEVDNKPGIFEGHMPKWYPLMFEAPGDGEGDLLVSVQLIPCSPDFRDIPPKPDITPPTRPAFMEIVAVGARNLLPYKLLPMSLVNIKFTLDTASGPVTNCTSQSKKPTPNDPNFLERIVVPVDLPKNPIFCPALRIAAYDTRLGGAMVPNIGNCRVDLRSKCPWSENYIPPRRLLKKETLAEQEGPELGGGETTPETEEVGGGVHGGERDENGNLIFKVKKTGEEEDEEVEAEAQAETGLDSITNQSSELAPPSDDENAMAVFAFEAGVAGDAVGARDMHEAMNRIETEASSSSSSSSFKTPNGTLANENNSGGLTATLGGDSFAQEALTTSPKDVELVVNKDDDDDDENASLNNFTFNENFKDMVTPPPRDVEDDLKLAMGFEDDGTGVFGDLTRLDKKWKNYQRQLEKRDARKEAGWFGGGNINDDISETESQIAEEETAMREHKYLIDRIDCEGSTLEEYLMGQDEGYTAPFEKYVMTRGQPKGSSFAAKDKDRSVGFFKGMIRIVEFDPTDKSQEEAEQALKALEHAPLVSDLSVNDVAAQVEVEEVEDLIDLSQNLEKDEKEEEKEEEEEVEEMNDDDEQNLEGFEEEEVQEEDDSLAVVKLDIKKEVEPKEEQINDLYNFHELLGKPKSYKVRVYAMRGIGLAAMDEGWAGRPGKSDPYIKASIGKSVYNNRANYIEDVVEADFFECIELDAELPGAPLIIEVMDKDDWTADDLIGKTVIDLEDRWFDDQWHSLGNENMCSEPGKIRWKTKPVEIRPLHIPAQQLPQGHLELWIDILEPGEALKFPIDDIMMPPPKPYQVRVIVWKGKDVVSMEALTNMNDTYTKVGIHGVKDQSTDIHWRAKKGKASWNYRLKFDIMLGLKTSSYKFPYLKFQMWDKDILKWDDLIAETMIDMSFYFKKALRQSRNPDLQFNTIKVFEDPPKSSKDILKNNLEPEELVHELNDYPPIPSDGKFKHLFEPKHVFEEVTQSVVNLASAADEVVGGHALTDMVGGGNELHNHDEETGHVEMTNQFNGKDTVGRPSMSVDDNPSSSSSNRSSSIANDEGVQLMTMNRTSSNPAPYRRKTSQKQASLSSSTMKKKSSTKTTFIEKWLFGDEGNEESETYSDFYGEEDSESLLDGSNDGEEEGQEEEAPRRRRRKKKKPTESACGCFCCLRCLCRGCCAVMTCSCFAPAEPPKPGEKAPPKPEPHLLLRTLPSLFGEGACKQKCPSIACLLRLICAIFNVFLALFMVVARILMVILLMVLRCVVQFFCECCISCFPCLACCMPEEDKDNDDEWEDVPEGEEEEADAEEEAEEAKQLSNQLATLVGRGPDPPDSGWLKMDRQSPKNPDQREPMGKLCVSIEIYSKEAAEMKPGGQGRRAPNTNPRLPPPTGRLKWSWNPFVMGSQLCGPKLCCYFCCFLLIGVFIVLSIYCQPFVNIMMWILVNLFIPG